MTRIALDAMGGDNAPGEIVRGGVEAAESLADVKVLLVGVQSQIEAELAKYPKAVEAAQKVGRLEVVHAPDVAEMELDGTLSVGLGIMMIVAGLLCRHGAELSQPEAAKEVPAEPGLPEATADEEA